MLVFVLESVILLGTAINCGYTITYHPESFTLKNLISYLTISASIILYLSQNKTSFWLLTPLVLVSLTLLIILDSRPAILNLLLGFITITSLYVIFAIFLNGVDEQLMNRPITYILFFGIVNACAIILRWLISKRNSQHYQEQFWRQNMNKALVLIIGSLIVFYIFSGHLKKSITTLPMTILQSLIILVVALIMISIAFLFLQHERQIQLLKETAVKQQAQDLQLYLNTLKASRHEYNSHINTIHQLLKSNQLQQLNDYMTELIMDNNYLSNVAGLKFPEISALLYRYELLARKKQIALTIYFDNNLSKLPMSLYDLSQLLGNLITNAFEASEAYLEQKPQVELSFSQSHQHVNILIKNTGKIKEAIKTNIIKPGISSKSKNQDRHGFGMYIISQLVDKYFGELVIKETNNDYVEIEISIPLS
ncbi:sensor histidine kinase [Leuconostoc sp. MS02]|uniref:Sensor histidine kinase n=1 Tax=Leuconostoc aquikimchii TaxID=3236804 RepID=A0ABV3S0F9_9LACO